MEALTAVKSRLFLTHQAALEFHKNRLHVVDQRLTDVAREAREIGDYIDAAEGKVRGFARRYQIEDNFRDDLVSQVNRIAKETKETLAGASDYDIRRESARLGLDPVLKAFDSLFENRIGPRFTPEEHALALAEANRRKESKTPPGYMDKKGGDLARQAGDYLVWRQLMMEAKKHQRPVLFICNEEKEDWIWKHGGETIGPRPELVLEFQENVGTNFYLLNVTGFLKNAKSFLGTAVSETTLDESETLSPSQTVVIEFRPGATLEFEQLDSDARSRSVTMLTRFGEFLKSGEPLPPNMLRLKGHRAIPNTTGYSVRVDENIRLIAEVTDGTVHAPDRIMVSVIEVQLKHSVRRRSRLSSESP